MGFALNAKWTSALMFALVSCMHACDSISKAKVLVFARKGGTAFKKVELHHQINTKRERKKDTTT